jgi:hypothetical protein
MSPTSYQTAPPRGVLYMIPGDALRNKPIRHASLRTHRAQPPPWRSVHPASVTVSVPEVQRRSRSPRPHPRVPPAPDDLPTRQGEQRRRPPSARQELGSALRVLGPRDGRRQDERSARSAPSARPTEAEVRSLEPGRRSDCPAAHARFLSGPGTGTRHRGARSESIISATASISRRSFSSASSAADSAASSELRRCRFAASISADRIASERELPVC